MTQQQQFSYDFASYTRSAAKSLKTIIDASNATPRLTSVTQLAIYAELCTKRNMEQQDISTMTYEDAFKLIKELKDFYPASQKQKDTVIKLVTELQNAGMLIKMPSQDVFDKMTGGAAGTAYKYIEFLINKQREIDMQQPPTDEQLRYIVSMYMFPDADFESYGVPLKLPMEQVLDKHGVPYTSVPCFTRPLPEQFAALVTQHMTRKQCAEFLDKHRVGFNAWKETRIRPQQEKRIRQIEERLANLTMPKEVAFSVDVFGNINETIPSSKRAYEPSAYTPMDTLQIRTLSIDDASRWITQLEADLAIKLPTAIDQSDVTLEGLRYAKSHYEWSIMELKEFNNFLHRIQAHSGLVSEGLDVVPYHDEHDRLTQEFTIDVFFDKENVASVRKRRQISDYLTYTLDTDLVKLHTMMLMAEKSDTATEMVKEIAEKVLKLPASTTRKAKTK